MLADWYSPSHIVTASFFYAALHVAARGWSIERRFLVSLAIESAGEIIEKPRRSSTATRGDHRAWLFGRQHLNNLSDIGMMALGFLAAASCRSGVAADRCSARAHSADRHSRQSDAQRLDAARPNDAIRAWQAAEVARTARFRPPGIEPSVTRFATSAPFGHPLPGVSPAAELSAGLCPRHQVAADAEQLRRGLRLSDRLPRRPARATPLQPYAFAAINSAGETNYGAVGLSAKFGGQVYVRPGLGIPIHTGSSGNSQRTAASPSGRASCRSRARVGFQVTSGPASSKLGAPEPRPIVRPQTPASTMSGSG